MQNKLVIALFFLFRSLLTFAQMPTCPSPYVFMDGGPLIRYYDPGMPLSATNPNTLNIPTFGSGLTLMPNINGGTLSPTFYSTSGGTYWYWNGVTWVNTGNSTGNGAAVNLGGCGSTIYNIVGGSGQVYAYSGTGSGTLLTTLSGFNGGGPYDLVTDCNCNFYALKTTTPNQNLTLYSPTGVPLCTYSLSGMPSAAAGGGFAIIGNMLYLKNNGTPGFYIANISGPSITFTAVPGFAANPGDFASCPVCYPPSSLLGTSISGGLLGCTIPTIGLAVTTTASPVTYNWSGPGIVGPNSGSVIIANSVGTYSCIVSMGGCPPAQVTLTTSVSSNSVNVLASITPSGTICLPQNGSQLLTVAHSATSDVVIWSGPGLAPVTGTDSIIVGIPGTYTVQVTDVFSGCVGRDYVTIANNPSVSLALSDNSLCAQNTSGSPATITITPSGAFTYTLFTSTNYSTNTPNGPTMPCYAISLMGNTSTLATGTLVGSNLFCTDTAITSFSIVPNPSISLSSTLASVCPGGSQALTASGAQSYVWFGSPGLNTNVGPNVIATPASNSSYSVLGTSDGCNSAFAGVIVNVLPIPTVSIAPASSTICLGSSITLSALGTAVNFQWGPLTGLSSVSGQTVSASPPNTQLYTVVGELNGCQNTATAIVHIVVPPVVSLAMSSSTLCAQNINNSPNNITLLPTGAGNYTLLGGANVLISSPNGPVMGLTPIGQPQSVLVVNTLTLIAVSSVCTIQSTHTVGIIPNPVLSISPPNSNICPGANQSFVANGANTYTWLPALNYSLSSANSIVAYPGFTSFYSVYGNTGGCFSDIKNAVLVILPVPDLTVSPVTSTVCAGSTVNIVASGNSASYSWFPPITLFPNYGATVTASPMTPQSYTVVGTLNTCTNQAVATVSAIPIPVITVSAKDYTVCKGSSTILEAQGAGAYMWFPNNNLNFPSGNVVISTPLQNTNYTVNGYNGICTGSASLKIVTVDLPSMSIISPDNQVCKGASIPIIVRGAQSYTWLPVAGLQFTGSDTLVYASPLSTTNYTVLGANSLGTVSCYQQLSYSVMVVPKITPVVSGNTRICLGEKTTLYASGGNTFSWSPASGLNITSGAGVVASPSISLVYTVEVSHNSFCGSSTTVQLNVDPRPTVFAGRDTSYNLNDAIFIRAAGSASLTWIAGESILCRDCPETQVYPSRSGCYVVQAQNESACVAFDEVCLVITEEFSIYLPNTFSPNGDGLNDLFLIFGEDISDVSLDVYDRWGTKIFHSSDVRIGWDGYYKGELCKEDVYTYHVSYTGLDRKFYTRTGNINLIR